MIVRVRLDKVKYKGRFVFPAIVEKELGTHGVFRVSVPYSGDRIRVRKLNAGDEFTVKYLETGTSIKDEKTGEKIEFPYCLLVLVEEKLLKGRISDAESKWKRVYQFPKHKNLCAVYDGNELMIQVYPNFIMPIDEKREKEVRRWLKDNKLDLDKLYNELVRGKELVSLK